MNCQKCGHPETSVLSSRKIEDGFVTRRVRGCGQCGHKYNTYEIDGGIWPTVKKWAIGDRAPALAKKHKLYARNEQIVAMIHAGHQLKDIAKQFGIAATTVCHVARKAGIPSREAPKKAIPTNSPWAGLL